MCVGGRDHVLVDAREDTGLGQEVLVHVCGVSHSFLGSHMYIHTTCRLLLNSSTYHVHCLCDLVRLDLNFVH